MQPVSEKSSQIDKKTLGLIFTAIRASFKQSERYAQIKDQNLSFEVGSRGGKRWFCTLCGVSTVEVEVDHHPEPVIALDRRWFSYSVDELYQNVFFLPCRLLCKSCHKAETKSQNKLRLPRKKLHEKTS